MKKTSLIVLALLVGGSLSACGKSETTPSATPAATASPSAATSPSATTSGGAGGVGGGTTTASGDAQTVFKANCVACHGANLEGGVGPNLQKIGGKLSKDQITATVTNGKGAMPSFKGKLSDGDISSLATWLADKK
ncbi:cytochrome c [Paenibacillus oryzisoli]|uniref:c-type cytochrome n=1 Tax=Paenibacillus oryzisoli TaxID=1850517 RepID=UPI003D2DF154